MTKFMTSVIRSLTLVIALVFLTQNSFAAIAKFNMRVNLSSHIISSSIANLNDTVWTLYKTTTISGGDVTTKNNAISTKVQTFTGAIKSLTLPVGQYVIKAQFGHAVSAKVFKVEQSDDKKFLNLKIIFDLGALRLSSSIGNDPNLVPHGVVDYMVRNTETGKIVFETKDVTSVFFLNAGDYNITAKFRDIMVTDAKFKILANNLNEVNIKHNVGQLNLNIDNIIADIKDIPPTWQLIGVNNDIHKEVSGIESSSLLLPIGDYKLKIDWAGYVYEQEFKLKAAEIVEFKIPKYDEE